MALFDLSTQPARMQRLMQPYADRLEVIGPYIAYQIAHNRPQHAYLQDLFLLQLQQISSAIGRYLGYMDRRQVFDRIGTPSYIRGGRNNTPSTLSRERWPIQNFQQAGDELSAVIEMSRYARFLHDGLSRLPRLHPALRTLTDADFYDNADPRGPWNIIPGLDWVRVRNNLR